jgi:hypothetical protein
MTWVKLDDGFPAHRKVRGLSAEAFRLHVTALCDCAAHLTDGAITGQAVRTLPGAPGGAKLKRAIDELVEAGLWEVSSTGWELHDFLDWNPSAESVTANREAARRRMNRLRSLPVRANNAGTNAEPDTNNDRSSCDRATRVPSRPVPSRSSNLTPDAEDLPGGSPPREPEPPRPVGEPQGKIPCPPGLSLTADQRATLETALIPGWAIDALTTEVVAGFQGDPADHRPLAAWRKCLSRAISGRWNDQRRREELLASAGPGAPLRGASEERTPVWKPPPAPSAVPCPPEVAARLRAVGYDGPLSPTGSGDS